MCAAQVMDKMYPVDVNYPLLVEEVFICKGTLNFTHNNFVVTCIGNWRNRAFHMGNAFFKKKRINGGAGS